MTASDGPPSAAERPATPGVPVPRERVPRVRARVAAADQEAGALLGRFPSSFTVEPLDFYPDAGLLRAIILLPTRAVAFTYVYHQGIRAADDRLYPLGTPERVMAANAAETVRIAPEHGVAYLQFYLDATEPAGWAGRRLVASADDVPWLPGTADDAALRAARERASRRVHPARADATGDGVRVTATTLRGRTLDVVTWHVTEDGRVTEEQRSTVTTDAPVVQFL